MIRFLSAVFAAGSFFASGVVFDRFDQVPDGEPGRGALWTACATWFAAGCVGLAAVAGL